MAWRVVGALCPTTPGSALASSHAPDDLPVRGSVSTSPSGARTATVPEAPLACGNSSASPLSARLRLGARDGDARVGARAGDGHQPTAEPQQRPARDEDETAAAEGGAPRR